MVSMRGSFGNDTRYVGQLNTLSLEFTHVKLPNDSRQIWRETMQKLTEARTKPTLSLLCDSKCHFVTD